GKSRMGPICAREHRADPPVLQRLLWRSLSAPEARSNRHSGGFGGAMENWGGITYYESALLFDPKKSSAATRQRIYEVIAHETAHQWFGDLVTMAWWDNLWLNDGFASWMGGKCTAHFNPDWEVWLAKNIKRDPARRNGIVMDVAMVADERSTAHALHKPCAN